MANTIIFPRTACVACSAISVPQLHSIACFTKPEHSLVVQAYAPKEMETALLNADGFGIGWYHPERPAEPPYTYRSIAPIWSDINLPELCRYGTSDCVVGYVRSATPGLAVDLSNCQPFSSRGLKGCDPRVLFLHNGYLENFRQTLYRPLRNLLTDEVYRHIQGTTDSEHLFASILDRLAGEPAASFVEALGEVLPRVGHLARTQKADFLGNILLSDGRRLVASRYAVGPAHASLYWLRDDPQFPDAVLVASEPLFAGDWNRCPEQALISVEENLEVNIHPIS